MSSSHVIDEPWESLFGLEDKFYQDGFQSGLADGEEAGCREGQVFGFEKGFERSLAAGRLYGRSTVWGARVQCLQTSTPQQLGDAQESRIEAEAPAALGPATGDLSHRNKTSLPTQMHLSDNPRLVRHIQTLCALVNPEDLSFENNEEAISNLDNRLKRGEAKAKLIERMVDEDPLEDGSLPDNKAGKKDHHHSNPDSSNGPRVDDQNIEDIKNISFRR